MDTDKIRRRDERLSQLKNNTSTSSLYYLKLSTRPAAHAYALHSNYEYDLSQ